MTPERPSVAMFLPSFAGGGAERSMITLARGFVAQGCSVSLLVARAEGPYKGAVDTRVRVIDFNVPRTAWSVPRLVRHLRTERPDALLSTLDYANVLALAATRLARVSTRVVVVEQNTISVTARQSRQWRQRMMPRLVRHCYQWADQVVGNSEGVAADLRTIIGARRADVRVIYNPVVTPETLDRAAAPPPHQWFESGAPPVVLGVGRLTPQKDFVSLVRAFARVRRTRRARLMILGEGPERGDLEALVHALSLDEDVLLPGFVENPYAYMSRAALFVLSSRWEGLPTVLIEALACGTPVVSTDCPSGPSEILAGGRFGRLVPVKDVTALADAMTRVLAGERLLPPKESWEPYELDAVVERYLALLSARKRTPREANGSSVLQQ